MDGSPTPQSPPTPPAPPGTTGPAPRPVKSADRTIEVMEALSTTQRRLSLADLHRRLGHPRSSLYMLLQTLVRRGWVEADPTGTLYGIGVRALLVGTSYLDGDPVVRAAAEVLDQVRARINETVHLARLEGGSVIYLSSRESQHHLRFISRVGRRQPAHTTALGRAILSTRSDDQVRALLPEYAEAMTDRTVTDHAGLLTEVEAARRLGYAAEREQSLPGLGCFAVPLPTADPVTDAISVSLPLARLDDAHEQEIITVLMESARRIGELVHTGAV